MKTRLGKSALKFSTPLVIVGALFLAGCGGGSDSTSAPPIDQDSDSDSMDVAVKATFDLNSSIDALDTLAAAATEAGSARKMAKDYSEKLGVIATGGSSMKAMENAAKVVGAKNLLVAAITDAEKKLTTAKAAKANLVADDPLHDSLDRAIKRAEGDDGSGGVLKAAKDVRDGDELKMYVEMVTGSDMDDLKTAADKGVEVAMAIMAALAPTADDNGAGLRVTHSTTAMGPDTASETETKAWRSGGDAPDSAMTWEEIVGDTMTRQISATGGGTTTVKVDSLKGEEATVLSTDAAGETPLVIPVDNTGAAASGAETGSTFWKGITGTLICGGTDCGVTDGKLTGSWYFTPGSTSQKYSMAAGSSVYAPYNLYATYGHWLTTTVDGDENTLTTVNTFSTSSGGAAAGTGSVSNSSNQASYKGSAAGMSSTHTFDPETGVEAGHRSGTFDAKIELTATFGASPTVTGKIDEFVGAAVGNKWSVNLGSTDITGTVGVATGSEDDTAGQAGTWTATAYGGSDATGDDPVVRPVGIHGGFEVHFPNGDAAGAYATRR